MRIYKYPLTSLEKNTIEINEEHKILSAGLDPNGVLCIWALVDIESPIIEKDIFVIGTGWDIDLGDSKFIGTVSQGAYMWHVFE